MIQKGNTVKIHYTGKFINGEVFDSSYGKDPVTFVIGENQVIPGFERSIINKNVGDKMTITITPEDGYGQVRPELFIKVPNNQLPGPVQVGQLLQATDSNGSVVNVSVLEMYGDHVIVDANHPLAGKDLIFDIEIVEAIE